MIIDAASERSEQGRFLSNRPGSGNAVLDATAPRTLRARLAGDRQCRVDPVGQDVKVSRISVGN